MCWTNLKKPHILTATEDIKVAKIITKHDRSIYYGHKYTKNVVEPRIELRVYRVNDGGTQGFRPFYIQSGYHSYLPDRVDVIALKETLSVYIKHSHDLIDHVFNRSVKVQEFVIPKGTRYCVNYRGEVVSETIKMI